MGIEVKDYSKERSDFYIAKHLEYKVGQCVWRFNIGDSIMVTNKKGKKCKAYLVDVSYDGSITIMDANCQKERNYKFDEIEVIQHIPKTTMPKPEIEEES